MSEPASRWAYRYDRLNRVTQTSHTTAAGKVDIHYQYSRFDNVKARWIRRDGVTIESSSYLYDNLNRLLGMRVKPVGHAGVPDQITTWRYNSAGQVIRRILPNGIRQLYAYDNAGRLAQIKYQRSDNSLIEQIDYTYDAVGQRTSKTLLNSTGGNETPMSASYDAANRMNSVTLNTAGTSKTYSLTYDDNGNLLKKENTQDPNDKTQYSWDARNRLTGLNQPNLQASFSYDSGGRRIAKTITANGQSNTTQYIYEGAQAIGEVRNGLLDASLISAGGLDEVIARVLSAASSQTASPQVRTYLTDALGSVIAQARADQTVENGYAYSPYGKTTKVGPEQGSAPNELQYTGRENDGTGLYYYRNRYYDPDIDRFISRDPIGLLGGLNEYAYVNGNPIMFTDPTGLEVYLCSQPAFGWAPVDHHWLKTDSYEAGMGGTRGNEPGNESGDRPGDPVQTTDHSGRSKQSNATCSRVEGVDEKTVNDLIKPGRPLGRWGPTNQCQSFVKDVLGMARRSSSGSVGQ